MDALVLIYTIMLNLFQVWQRLKIHIQQKCLQDQKYINAKLFQENVNLTKENVYFPEFTAKLQNYLHAWSQIRDEEGCIQLEIYHVLGNAVLKPQILATILETLSHETRFRPVELFYHLQDFYLRWCRGEFIDAPPDHNFPQQKILQLQANNITLGLRQIDINTGLNVLILLLELHYYAQKHSQLSQKIIFIHLVRGMQITFLLLNY